jgi:hypothetical protein
MISGRVIRIFDKHRIAVNIGADDGVEVDMKLGIYTPPDPIVDPESGVELGFYRRQKASVVVEEVHPKFAIAGPPRVRERLPDPEPESIRTIGATLGIGTSARPSPRYRLVQRSLDIENREAKPLPTGETVRVGDTVEVLSED